MEARVAATALMLTLGALRGMQELMASECAKPEKQKDANDDKLRFPCIHSVGARTTVGIFFCVGSAMYSWETRQPAWPMTYSIDKQTGLLIADVNENYAAGKEAAEEGRYGLKQREIEEVICPTGFDHFHVELPSLAWPAETKSSKGLQEYLTQQVAAAREIVEPIREAIKVAAPENANSKPGSKKEGKAAKKNEASKQRSNQATTSDQQVFMVSFKCEGKTYCKAIVNKQLQLTPDYNHPSTEESCCELYTGKAATPDERKKLTWKLAQNLLTPPADPQGPQDPQDLQAATQASQDGTSKKNAAEEKGDAKQIEESKESGSKQKPKKQSAKTKFRDASMTVTYDQQGERLLRAQP